MSSPKVPAAILVSAAALLVVALAMHRNSSTRTTTSAISDSPPPAEPGVTVLSNSPATPPRSAARLLSSRPSSANRGDASPVGDEPTSEPVNPNHPYLSEDLLALDDSYEPDAVFKAASEEFKVPADLLKAVAYLESQGNHGHGVMMEDRSFGVMRLREREGFNTLEEAARLLGEEKKTLVLDPAQNIRGAAALIRAYHDEAQRSGNGSNPWLVAVTLYSGRPADQSVQYAHELANVLQEGLSHTLQSGQLLFISPRQQHLLGLETPQP